MTPLSAIDFASISGTTRSFLVAGGIVVLASLAGYIVERVVLRALKKLAENTDFKFDDIIVSSFRGVARWGFFLFGLFAALPVLPLPEGSSDEIRMAARIAVLVVGSIVVGRFASGVAAHYAYRVVPSSVSLAKIVVNVIVLTIGLLIVFQTIGIQITPILGALGVGGLAVALAMQETLANFFAGLQVLASRQIRVGDFVQLDSGQEGFVTDVSWRAATIRMLNNNMVIVPNTKLAQAVVTNYALGDRDFSIWLTVGVAYPSDLDKVEKVTLEVAREVVKRVGGAVKDFEPLVRFHTFGDFSINFNVVVRCYEYGPHFLVISELVKAIHKRYAAEGIEIPFPIRTVMMKGGSPQ